MKFPQPLGDGWKYGEITAMRKFKFTGGVNVSQVHSVVHTLFIQQQQQTTANIFIRKTPQTQATYKISAMGVHSNYFCSA
mmetsp:Transcript_371/g.782  ORF Transcript_371/g.782 Transcript_371/m.782 type:complete len:80 (-) Transcript_371:109-348(-)